MHQTLAMITCLPPSPLPDRANQAVADRDADFSLVDADGMRRPEQNQVTDSADNAAARVQADTLAGRGNADFII